MVKYSGSSSLGEVILVFLGNKFTIAVVLFLQVLIDRVMQDIAKDNCFHVTNQVSRKVTICTEIGRASCRERV